MDKILMPKNLQKSKFAKLALWGFTPSIIGHFLHFSLHLHDSHLKTKKFELHFHILTKKSYRLFQLCVAWHLLTIKGFQFETVRHTYLELETVRQAYLELETHI